MSDYGLQLREKQKLRRMYGVLERQFRTYYKKAAAYEGFYRREPPEDPRGPSGQHCLPHGFCGNARRSAPAGERTGRVLVNNKIVNIPSYQVSAGDTVEIREKAKKQTRIQSALAIASQVGFPDWVQVDDQKMVGILKQVPAREDILPDINENLVVELYSK